MGAIKGVGVVATVIASLAGAFTAVMSMPALRKEKTAVSAARPADGEREVLVEPSPPETAKVAQNQPPMTSQPMTEVAPVVVLPPETAKPTARLNWQKTVAIRDGGSGSVCDGAYIVTVKSFDSRSNPRAQLSVAGKAVTVSAGERMTLAGCTIRLDGFTNGIDWRTANLSHTSN